jgi:hypothetical protein
VPLPLAPAVQALHRIAVNDHPGGAGLGNQLCDPPEGGGGNPKGMQFPLGKGFFAGMGAEEFHG